MEPRIAKLDVNLIREKSELLSIVRNYKAYVENHFPSDFFTVRHVRFDNAAGNIDLHFVNFL